MGQVNSISIRLRRTTTEVAHVSVPITQEFLVAERGDPTVFKVDVDKLFIAALARGAQPDTSWQIEGEAVIEIHPVQEPPTCSGTQ
jgi:hypothetical protein